MGRNFRLTHWPVMQACGQKLDTCPKLQAVAIKSLTEELDSVARRVSGL